ncbi:hypothetical protein OJAV_G00133160 [Oryzias javanicus]|uniref:Uncharacterized protein n=1 Tax=Oryzias javanicus TaxID=123683 RepID=A0A3S2MRA2_ORYJA|nr:hypothetical protein OJAV_G00133160 [Oryzias javanicus]
MLLSRTLRTRRMETLFSCKVLMSEVGSPVSRAEAEDEKPQRPKREAPQCEAEVMRGRMKKWNQTWKLTMMMAH